MQFWFLLLPSDQFVLATFASSHDPNRPIREDGNRRYIVYATDPSTTAETEALLTRSFGSNNIVPGQLDNGVASWTIISHGEDLTNTINELAAVRTADQEAVPPAQPSEPRNRSGRQDAGIYMVVPILGSDLKKTEDFIQSKVQPGTKIARVTDESRITAWFNLYLDSEAVEAVQSFEGVAECEPALENHYNGALLASDKALVSRSFVTPDQKDTVSRRVG
jgi:hypothetical protein